MNATHTVRTLLLLAAPALLGGALGCNGGPHPKRIGVFVDADGKTTEITAYAREAAGLPEGELPPVVKSGVRAFYANIPDSIVSESGVYFLEKLDRRWHAQTSSKVPAKLEKLSGNLYRFGLPDAKDQQRVILALREARQTVFLGLRVVMPLGVPDRMYAVQLGEAVSPAVGDEEAARRTMGYMRSLATAVEAYAVDFDRYPPSGSSDGTIAAGRGARMDRTLAGYVSPTYIRRAPLSDGWNSWFIYECDAEGSHYQFQSAGKDGLLQTSQAIGATTDPNADLIYRDGQFVQWPKDVQR